MARSIADQQARAGRPAPPFVNRTEPIRTLVRTLSDPQGERIVFVLGPGGQGKSALLRFTREHLCRQHVPAHRAALLGSTEPAVTAQLFQDVDPLPVAHLGFGVVHSADENPRDSIVGMTRIARTLSPSGLRFPYFYYGQLVYRQALGYLDPRTAADLIPASELSLLQQLMDLATSTSRYLGLAVTAASVLGSRTGWNPQRAAARRRLDPGELACLEGLGDPVAVLEELPRLLAHDINAYTGPGPVTVILDAYEALFTGSGTSPVEIDRNDWWIRALINHVDLDRVVVLLAGRRRPGWEHKARWPVPAGYVRFLELGPLDPDSGLAVLRARGLADGASQQLLARLPRQVGGHPLSLTTVADLDLLGPGHRVADPAAGVLDVLLDNLDEEDAALLRALCAARTFDADLALAIADALRIRVTAGRVGRLCALAVCVPAGDAAGTYAVHDLLRELVGEQDAAVVRAHRFLAEHFRRLATGDRRLQFVDDVIYHEYWVPDRRPAAVATWLEVMRTACDELDWTTARSMLTLRGEFARDPAPLPPAVHVAEAVALHGLGFAEEARQALASARLDGPDATARDRAEGELWQGFLATSPAAGTAHFVNAALRGARDLGGNDRDPALVHLVGRAWHMAAEYHGHHPGSVGQARSAVRYYREAVADARAGYRERSDLGSGLRMLAHASVGAGEATAAGCLAWLAEAEEQCTAALTYRQDDPRALHNLCDVHLERAVITADDGDPAAAEAWAGRALDVAEHLADLAPGWEPVAYLRCRGYASMMALVAARGADAEAGEWRRRAVSCAEAEGAAASARLKELHRRVEAFTCAPGKDLRSFHTGPA